MSTKPGLHGLLSALAALTLVAGATACGAQDGDHRVTVAFWGWAPGYPEAVARYNATHPGIHVEYTTVAPGSQGGYEAVQASVKGGKAPCLVQMGYESLPSFASDGLVQPISDEVLGTRVYYSETAWQQATVAGEIYGFPVDVGPMALYYRSDLYAQYGLEPQRTWQDFATDAARLHQAAPTRFLTAFTPDDPWWFAGLAAQAGGSWFDVKGRSWQVDTADPNSARFTAYWQSLLDKGLAKSETAFSDGLFEDLQNGTLAAFPGPVWFSSLLAQKSPAASGKWAVAPMPRWTAGDTASGFDGGSATALLKGCAAARPALDFANWLSSDRDSLQILVDRAGIYPAAVTADTLPALNRPDPYFGNQPIFGVFRDGLGRTNWTWGPVMADTSKALSTELGKAVTTRTPLRSALQAVRDRTVAAMRGKNIEVAAR
ncbi:ABC transporter substrate-binding protein [Kitasatospora sp. NPDC048365]|uniref:ABC transporter substrate-binding protein n=1 Tax=Kitasatospora sp. NPDC048365 TaxID=3364050 RepID=UPI0037122622